MVSLCGLSQSTLPLRADTVLIEKGGGNGEFKLKNRTRDTLGPLINIGGGKTGFFNGRRYIDSLASIPIDVFGMFGQSNMQGYNTNGITDTVHVIPGTAFQYYQGFISIANDPIGNASNSSMGPAFAKKYFSLTSRYICLVPSAFSGTSQTVAANTGQGTWDTTGTLFDTSVARVVAAMAALRAAGYNPTFKGILWCQGETDAIGINGSLTTQAAYLAAFQKMIGKYRTRFGKQMPFYIYQIATQTSASDVGYASVRAAQLQIVHSDSLTNIVFTNALDFPARGKFSDQYHYTQSGYNEMGTVSASNIVGANYKWQPQSAYTYIRSDSVGVGIGIPLARFHVLNTGNIAAIFQGRVGINRTGASVTYPLDVGDSARFRGALMINNNGFGGAPAIRTTSFLTLLNTSNITIIQGIGATYPELRFAGQDGINVPYSAVINGTNLVNAGTLKQPLLITTSRYFGSPAGSIILRPNTDGTNRNVERVNQIGNDSIYLQTVNTGETFIDGLSSFVGRIKAYSHISADATDSVVMWSPTDSIYKVRAIASFASSTPTLQQVTDAGATTNDNITILNNQNGATGFEIQNNSAGAGAESYMALRNDLGYAALELFGSGAATSNTALFTTSNTVTGGLTFATLTTAPIKFNTNSNGTSNERMRIGTSGEINISDFTDQGAYTLQNTGGLYQNGAVSLNGQLLGNSSMIFQVKGNDSLLYNLPIASFITSSTYTPTLTNTTNITASTAHVTGYRRVINSVDVWGEVEIDPVAGALLTELTLSLPIASTLSNSFELAGSANNDGAIGNSARIHSNGAGAAVISFIPNVLTNATYSFHFSYTIN